MHFRTQATMNQLIDTTICPRIFTEVADFFDCNWTTTNSTFRHEVKEFVDLYSDLLVNSMLHMPRYNEIVEKDPTYESKWWNQLFENDTICIFPNFYCDTYITPFYCNRTEEKEWLRQFYNSAGGTNWTNSTNWMTDTDYCDWFGVKCCSAIPMQYTIKPPFIHNLQDLPHKCINYLNFGGYKNQKNNVAGSLPPWWFNSTVFTMFFIENEENSQNHLTGFSMNTQTNYQIWLQSLYPSIISVATMDLCHNFPKEDVCAHLMLTGVIDM